MHAVSIVEVTTLADYIGNNIFEKLGALIPGYRGYVQREGRRDTDKMLRNHMATHLQENIDVFDRLNLELLRKGRLEDTVRVDEVKRRTLVLADEIRYCSYGASGFFDLVQVDESLLDSLYLRDVKLKNLIDALIAMFDNVEADDQLEKNLQSLDEAIAHARSHLEQRSETIRECV